MHKDDFLNTLTDEQRQYDYTLVPDTFTYNEKIPIICNKKNVLGKEHGVFYVTYGHFKRGDKCPKCRGKYMSKEEFITEANIVHNNSYDYNNIIFKDKKTKVKIYCPKHKIYFEQTPQKHLSGQGCPKCRYEKSSKSNTKTRDEFIQEAKEIHSNKYDYSKVEYINDGTKVCIICPEHGEFWQTPSNHLNKHSPQGCSKCGRKRVIEGRLLTFDEFVKKANKTHNNKYTYIRETYTKASDFVDIICPIHGVFKQKGTNHIDLGQGCKQCSNQTSLAEEEICEWLEALLTDCTIERRNRKVISPFELDIYIPEKRIAIEYNGLVWHSEKYNNNKKSHLEKTEKCKAKGIRLIHIFEDEWIYKKEITKSRLKSIFGVNKNVIYARKCIIKEVSSKDSKLFLDENHIQGFCKAKYHYGLYYNNELVSLMTFGCLRQMKKSITDFNEKWELLRFCNKLNTTVVGGASKLLKHFINAIKPKCIISYADRRWSVGNLYFKLGFKHTHNSMPNYFYVIGKCRENRFKYRKGELIKNGFDKNKSEHQIMLERGIYRIYDCGTMVFKMTF